MICRAGGAAACALAFLSPTSSSAAAGRKQWRPERLQHRVGAHRRGSGGSSAAAGAAGSGAAACGGARAQARGSSAFSLGSRRRLVAASSSSSSPSSASSSAADEPAASAPASTAPRTGSSPDGVPSFRELVQFTIPFMGEFGFRLRPRFTRALCGGLPRSASHVVSSSSAEKQLTLDCSFARLPSLPAVWIASPVLSLIDTSIVGLGSTLELAALSPATSVCNNVCHLLGFLGVATTGLVARALARGDVPEAKASLDQALRVAVTTGAVVGAAFIALAVPMLAAFAGPACTELVDPAVVYTRIRALGFPFALAMSEQGPPPGPTPPACLPAVLCCAVRDERGSEASVCNRPRPAEARLKWGLPLSPLRSAVGQAASLACKDPGPPVRATIVAAVANLFGDTFLCVYPFKFGIAGAAWATVAAQAVRVFV